MDNLYSFLYNISPYLVLALLVVTVLLLIWIAALQARFNTLMRHYRRVLPSGHGNLDELLETQLSELQQTGVKMDDLLQAVRLMDAKSRRAIQHVGVLRFNPFEDTGGDQSFCVALLDGEENGVVLSSIFNRSQCRVYAKPIERGHSRYQLSDEEEEALNLAHDGRAKSVVR